MSTLATARSPLKTVDVLIVTAIKIEYDAVLEVHTGALPGSGWDRQMGPTGFEVAFRTFQAVGGVTLRVAVTRALEMGGVATATAAAPLVQAYSPQCLAMCGVCAGRRGKLELGDVIIADRLWTYDTGKLEVEKDDHGQEQPRVQGDMLQYQLNARWKHAAESFTPEANSAWLSLRPRSYEAQMDWVLQVLHSGDDPAHHRERETRCTDYSDKIIPALWERGWVQPGTLNLTDAGRQYIQGQQIRYPDGLLEPRPFQVHLGPIGTGSKVVKDPRIFEKLSESMRTVLGLEMEAAAIGALAHQQNIPYMVVMKGVMDFADPAKSDHFKPFAARASAECLLAFLCAHPPQPPIGRSQDVDAKVDELLRPGTLKPPRERGPAALLNARYQFVDFFSSIRSALLRDLQAWCEEDEPVSVRLFHGEGGTGKTHLFIEWCKRLSAQGWRAGFLDGLPEPDDLAKLLAVSASRPVLAVIDYAESQQGVRALLQIVARRREASRSHGRFRLVLIAREPGDWWEELQRRSTSLQAILSDRGPTEVPPLKPRGTEREEVFWHAARCFARILERELPAHLPLPLDDPRFERVLYIHMAALAAVLGLPFTAETLMKDILDHEEHFWNVWGDSRERSAIREGDSRLFQRRVRQAVTAMTLTGGASSQEKALALLQRSCGSRDELLLLLLRDLYPGMGTEEGRWEVGSLEPDLLGEAMVLRTLRAEGQGVEGWLRRVFEGMDERGVRTGFEVLGRLSVSAREAGDWIGALMEGAVAARSVAALEAAKAVGQRTAHAALAEELAKALKREGTPEVAIKLEAVGIPERLVSLQEVAAWIAETLLSQLAGEGREVLVERARLKNNLGGSQSVLGRRVDALASMREAVEHYRTLAREYPEGFLPFLVGSLNNLSKVQSELGQRQEALASAQEALGYCRALAPIQPPTFLPALASSLNALNKVQSELGQREEALASARESVGLFRTLVQIQPEEFLPDLALSLHNLGSTQSAMGQREEALASAREAVSLYGQLARRHLEAFLPNLAMSLNNLSACQSELGQMEEALVSMREVVGHYRTLARKHPEAFLPELAMSLNNLGSLQSKLGQTEEALATVQESVGHYQMLVRKHPEAFLPNLAMSLNTLCGAQHRLGQREPALESALKAVDYYRTLAQRHPEAFLPNLAGSLSNLAVMQRELEQREEALASARESVGHYRTVVQKHPEAFLPALASSLANLSRQQGDLGQSKEALASAREAVDHYRALVQKHPEAFLPSLAMCLNNQGNQEGELGLREQALASVQETVGYYRTLAEKHREAFLPCLAGSLNNLGATQGRLKQRNEALASVQEAVGHYRTLVSKHPDAFLSDLTVALNNLAEQQMELGHKDEALVSAREALAHCRTLVQKHPEVFLPDLAASLNNLANVQNRMDQREEALVTMHEMIGLCRGLAQKHPERFLHYLVSSLHNRG